MFIKKNSPPFFETLWRPSPPFTFTSLLWEHNGKCSKYSQVSCAGIPKKHSIPFIKMFEYTENNIIITKCPLCIFNKVRFFAIFFSNIFLEWRKYYVYTLKILVYPFLITVCGGCIFPDHISTLLMYLFIT